MNKPKISSFGLVQRITYICSEVNSCKEPCKGHGHSHAKKTACNVDCDINSKAKCEPINLRKKRGGWSLRK